MFPGPAPSLELASESASIEKTSRKTSGDNDGITVVVAATTTSVITAATRNERDSEKDAVVVVAGEK